MFALMAEAQSISDIRWREYSRWNTQRFLSMDALT